MSSFWPVAPRDVVFKTFSSIKDPGEAEGFGRLDCMIGINAKPQPGSQAPAPQRPPRSVRVIKLVSPGATGHN